MDVVRLLNLEVHGSRVAVCVASVRKGFGPYRGVRRNLDPLKHPLNFVPAAKAAAST